MSEAWKSAYIVHRSGLVKELKDMIYGRFSCGVVVWKKAVYVFGSFGGDGANKAEKGNLGGKEWKLVGEMHRPRSSFTPAVWLDSAFLCGGYRNNTIEAFDGEAIRLLDLQLPEGTNTLCCLHSSSLAVMTSHYLVLLSKRGTEVEKEEKRHSICALYLYQAPVLFGEALVNVTEDKVLKYSIETGESLA